MFITLCGSTRFIDRFHDANRRLTAAGHVVYSVCMVTSAERGESGPLVSGRTKEVLDLVHLMKIANSQAILVVGWNAKTDDDGGRLHDRTNYVGDSTRREITWATMNKKDVYDESHLDRLCAGAYAPRVAVEGEFGAGG